MKIVIPLRKNEAWKIVEKFYFRMPLWKKALVIFFASTISLSLKVIEKLFESELLNWLKEGDC